MKTSGSRGTQNKSRGAALGPGRVKAANQLACNDRPAGTPLERECARMVEVLEEWMTQHRKMYEAHAAEQERLVRQLLHCHTETLRELELARGAGGEGGEPHQPPELPTQPDACLPEELKALCGTRAGAGVQESGPSPQSEPPWPTLPCIADLTLHDVQDDVAEKGKTEPGSPKREAVKAGARCRGPRSDRSGSTEDGDSIREEEAVFSPPRFARGPADGVPHLPRAQEAGGIEGASDMSRGGARCYEDALAAWTQCSGLHTVSKWVTNYRKHPAGWAALLMIHGIPEVTSRLRSKVDNYAIYSALFLSMSMQMLIGAPDFVTQDCSGSWECHLRRRLYTFCFAAGTAAHMLCILLGMAFNNALNEAARDSDVYRLFARGKGFVATVKCQHAFTAGCAADFIALMVVISACTSWPEALGGFVVLTAIVLYVYMRTASLLFTNASIVRYWREELGGKPDKDDPYDLQVPVDHFRHRARFNDEHFRKLADCAPDSAQAAQILARLHQCCHLRAAAGQAVDSPRGDAGALAPVARLSANLTGSIF